MKQTFCLFLLSIFVKVVHSQVGIEVYDGDVFASKIDTKVYNPNVSPQKEKPMVVNVSLFLDHFGPYDETKSQFSMALQVHMNWIDERLAFSESNGSQSKVLHFKTAQIHQLNIWRPSIYFSNVNMLNPDLLSDKSSGQIMGRISSNGQVHIVKRTTMTGSCKVNIKLYPVDVQQCSIQLESTSSDKQLNLQWVSGKQIVFGSDFSLSNFDWIDNALFSSHVSYQAVGPFSRLKVIFFLRRQLGYYLLEAYLPSALFVISSWTSFWIDIPAAPARVALVLTTMLTHVTSSKAMHDKTPRVSFIHSLDVWSLVCTMFIFASIVEYATANYFFHKPDRVERKNKEKGAKNKSNEAKTTNLDMNDERRFSMNSIDPTMPKQSSMGRMWNRALQWAIPPFEQIKPRRRALEIDRKARILFPASFLIFNVLYWSILLYYSYKTRDPLE